MVLVFTFFNSIKTFLEISSKEYIPKYRRKKSCFARIFIKTLFTTGIWKNKEDIIKGKMRYYKIKN